MSDQLPPRTITIGQLMKERGKAQRQLTRDLDRIAERLSPKEALQALFSAAMQYAHKLPPPGNAPTAIIAAPKSPKR